MKFFADRDELYVALNDQATSIQGSELHTGESITIAPNPVARLAMITLRIPESSGGMPAKLAIFDLSGRMVRTLVSGPLPSGYFMTEWDCSTGSGNRVPPGSYFLIWE
jgi:flagellar hook assembly protein FlgD